MLLAPSENTGHGEYSNILNLKLHTEKFGYERKKLVFFFFFPLQLDP